MAYFVKNEACWEFNLELVPETEPATPAVKPLEVGEWYVWDDGRPPGVFLYDRITMPQQGKTRVHVLSEAEWAQIEREREAAFQLAYSVSAHFTGADEEVLTCHRCKTRLTAYDAARAERSKGNE